MIRTPNTAFIKMHDLVFYKDWHMWGLFFQESFKYDCSIISRFKFVAYLKFNR